MVFINYLKSKENVRRLLFTLLVIAACATMSAVPVAGINTEYLASAFGDNTILGFADMMSGGAMSRMSMSCFGISSYISASIIMQLVAILFPKVETMRKDGLQGQKRIEHIQFALAMAFTLAGALGMVFAFNAWDLWEEFTPYYLTLAVASWLLGTFLTVFLAQKVEDYGIGNGIGLVLACNILSRIPNSFLNFYEEAIEGVDLNTALPYIIGIAVGIFIFFLLCSYLQHGILYTPINQNKKKASALNMDPSIPINVNVASVIPVVYTAALFSIPMIVIGFFDISTNEVADEIMACLTTTNWYAPAHWYYLCGLAAYILLILVFSFFSSEMNFSAAEIAENMRKNGDVIPGISPGKDTADYLDKRRRTMALLNFLFLVVIAIVPDFICTRAGLTSFSFLGTSLLIVVGVFTDFASRIRAKALQNDKRLALFTGKRRRKACRQ